MTSYAIKNLMEVDTSTSAPPGLEARLARQYLDSEQLGVSHFRYAAGVRTPFGHSHGQQEEAYVVVGGSGRAKLGEEVVELALWDVVRVAQGTLRAFEGGPDGLELIAIGSAVEEGEGGVTDPDFWVD